MRINTIAVDGGNNDELTLYYTAAGLDIASKTAYSKIIKYDSKAGKQTVLLDRWDQSNITYIVLWDNYIYFSGSSALDGTIQVHRMSNDGSDITLMKEFSDCGSAIPYFFHDGMLYFCDFDMNLLYCTDKDFADVKTVSPPKINNENLVQYNRVYDGYLYYMEKQDPLYIRDEIYSPRFDWNKMEFVDDFILSNDALYRIKFNDPDAEPERVSELIFSNMLINDGKLYIGKSDHLIIGVGEAEDEDKVLHPTYFTNPMGGVKVIDLDTMEEEVVFEKSKYKIRSILYADENYVAFSGFDAENEFKNNETPTNFYRYDRNAKTFEQLY